MKYRLLGFISLIAFNDVISAQNIVTPSIPQVTTCITAKFSGSGDKYWKNMALTLTNNCSLAVDFQNTTVTFVNTNKLNTNFWGDFNPLPYPDNALNITSQIQTDGKFLASLNLHFPSYSNNTKLPVGQSFTIRYGNNSDTHIEGSTKVYLATPVETGTLILKNASKKPINVSSSYALVHLSKNGQIINDVQIPWESTKNVTGLATGNYALSIDSVSDSQGNDFQGTAVPNNVDLKVNAQVNSTITYTQTKQTGKIIVNLKSSPSELGSYDSTPSVIVTNSSGNSVSQSLPWNTSTTISQLKLGVNYQLSTPIISNNGYNCTPAFTPPSVIASANASTTLTYKCVLVAQNSINVNVTGGPSSLSSLKINLMPNDGSSLVPLSVSLINGSGSNTIGLTDGLIYTLSSDAVSGYSISFSPQPLTATANATETVTLKSQTGATPIAINGQLTVCGTQLCNKDGIPVQLKGLSTHGLQWFGSSTCITPESLDYLVKNVKANVIRLSMYVQEGGYESNPSKFTQEINSLINSATTRGVYIIVDWHILNPGDPNYNLANAKKFFTDVITANKGKTNLLYEIANEPNGVKWTTIKNYADQIIPVIRALDPKSPIIIGTPGWSSLGVSDGATYQEIVSNPVAFPNVMYAFHFYAASHKDDYLNALDRASQVLPIFVTEFGTQSYSGDGANDFVMSDRYMQLMSTKKIGWTNWNFSDDFRSGAIWKTNTCASKAWVDGSLKPAGTYIKNKVQTP